MAPVLFGSPAVPPPPPLAEVWTGLPMTWEGWDGTLWDLTDPRSGVRMKRGVRGLHMPEFTHWRSSSPSVAGQRWRGGIAEMREAFWPITIFQGAGSQEWMEYDRAFWRTLDPTQAGIWTVKHPDGKDRSLRLRHRPDPGHAYGANPFRIGWAKYGVLFDAEQPFWEGPRITQSFKAGTSRAFLPSASGEGYWLTSGSTLDGATLTNPGDVDAPILWEVEGPVTSVTVGVDGETIVAPINVPAGQVLTINADPANPGATLAGVDVTKQLTTAEFEPLPRGEAVPLTLAMVGTGTVRASFVPHYYRAW